MEINKRNGDETSAAELQYSLDTEERRLTFIDKQYPTPELRKKYDEYREEWKLREREHYPGNKPLSVTCELVSICNLQCSMCYTINESWQQRVVGTQRIMPWSMVTAIIDECALLGVPSMLFSWRGEPTLYKHSGKDLGDVLQYAHNAGILEITFSTNGRKSDANLTQKIVDAEPNWINFSVDGLDDTYNKIRKSRIDDFDDGLTPFSRVAINIYNMIAYRNFCGKTRPQIRTNTIYPAIVEYPDNYYKFMKNVLEVDWITTNMLVNFRNGEFSDDELNKDFVCSFPFQRMTIAANGFMYPCASCEDEDIEIVIGKYPGAKNKIINLDGRNIIFSPKTLTIAEAWHSAWFKAVRDCHKRGDRLNLPVCRRCERGIKSAPVTCIPKDWDMENMRWRE